MTEEKSLELYSGFNFENNPDKPLRCIIIEGKPWFFAGDVCKDLELQNPSYVVSRLEDDEKLVYSVNISGGQARKALFVNESGLYSLVFTSRKKEAVKFRKWVTNVVLPQIRETGTFNSSGNQSIDAMMQMIESIIETKVKDIIGSAIQPIEEKIVKQGFDIKDIKARQTLYRHDDDRTVADFAQKNTKREEKK